MALAMSARVQLQAEESLPASTAVSSVSATSADAGSQQLLTRLPKVAEIKLIDGKVCWHGPANSLIIDGIEPKSKDPLVKTELGDLRIPKVLITQHRTQVISELPMLVTRARDAGLQAKDISVMNWPIAGTCLLSPEVMVVKDDLLFRRPIIAADRTAEREQLRKASSALDDQVGLTGLDAVGTGAFDALLASVSQDDDDEQSDIKPFVARRVIKHGYLRRWFVQEPAASEEARLERAVIRAMDFQAVDEYGDATRSFQIVKNLMRGNQMDLLADADKVSYALFRGIPKLPLQVMAAGGRGSSGRFRSQARRLEDPLGKMLDIHDETLASWSCCKEASHRMLRDGASSCIPTATRMTMHPTLLTFSSKH